MIPRTKHLVVTTLSLVGLLALSGVLSFPHQTGALFSEQGSPALLIESDITAPEVVIETSSLREEMRKKLRDTLRSYVSLPSREEKPSPTEVMKEESNQKEEPPAPAPVSLLLCEGVGTVPSPRSSWGEVRIVEGEGARVIRSTEETEPGLPLRALQLPLEPTVNDTPSCLPQIIGVLVDGTVITPNTPITTEFEGRAGYAVDGFPIFAQYEDGKKVSNEDLDQCHGHMHEIVDQGVVQSVYHYHITDEAPYTLGCFRGTPVTE